MSLSELGAKRARRELPAIALEATVLSPPLTPDGFLRVEVDAQKGIGREGPWAHAGGLPTTAQPAAEDAALAIESDQGNLWLLWWPQ